MEWDGLMYESPVNIFETNMRIVEEINKSTDEHIMKAIKEVGIDVNKDELLKAINYDREQYKKGYKDALETFIFRSETLKDNYANTFSEYLCSGLDMEIGLARELQGE